MAPFGCSSPRETLATVEGTLRWNKKPLANVHVMFLPNEAKGTKGKQSAGVTDENGHFKLMCDNGQPGAVVGFHKVVVMTSARMTDRGDKGEQAADASKVGPKPAIPSKYQSAATTPVEREVKAEAQTIDLDLP
jgi:hypothetical protein